MTRNGIGLVFLVYNATSPCAEVNHTVLPPRRRATNARTTAAKRRSVAVEQSVELGIGI